MIKTLRRKFIAIAMCSIGLVLVALITGINVVNYVNVCRTADARISMILTHGRDGYLSDNRGGGFNRHQLSAEAPYDTRYFMVTIDKDGTVLSINTGKIAAISTSQASEYATFLWRKHRENGFIGDYRYQAIAASSGAGQPATTYVFLHAERELGTFRNFLRASIGISLLGLLLVFLLVVFLSKKALIPAAESYEKQKRFITDASHEIKTPLAIIAANTEVIEMNSGESQWTISTKNQIARLTSLTEKLVFLSRMDEESTRLDMREFALSEAVRDTAEPFCPLAKSKGKRLELAIQPDITMKGDEATIRQLVSLLLDNAVKYSGEDGMIRLDLHTGGKSGTKILSVRNSVDAIEPGRHEELFERFYRADESRSSKTGGFGIGLSAAKAIVNAHKGKITAKSEDGKSLVFTVTLP